MQITIAEAIERMVRTVPGAPFEQTVDTVKCGDPSQALRGIAVAFTVTFDVIAEAARLGANLIVTHEPTYYNHHDREDFIAGNEVYEAKRALLQRHGLTVWRWHDYWHAHRPDGILHGVLARLGWHDYANPDHSPFLRIPAMTLRQLADLLKRKLDIPYVRIAGDLAMPCSGIGMLLGAVGGEAQMRALARADVDVVVCGETVEWMTAEYVRDANSAGQRKAIVVLGHFKSEEAGMAYLADWLRPLVPGVPVHYVASGDPLMLA